MAGVWYLLLCLRDQSLKIIDHRKAREKRAENPAFTRENHVLPRKITQLSKENHDIFPGVFNEKSDESFGPSGHGIVDQKLMKMAVAWTQSFSFLWLFYGNGFFDVFAIVHIVLFCEAFVYFFVFLFEPCYLFMGILFGFFHVVLLFAAFFSDVVGGGLLFGNAKVSQPLQ